MSSSDSTDGATVVGQRLVRTTGLQPTVERAAGEEGGDGIDGAIAPDEDHRLRTRVTELEGKLDRARRALETRETRLEELAAELESTRRERDDAREWAAFLDDELRDHRERVETLEERVRTLESGRGGLLDRIRGLLG